MLSTILKGASAGSSALSFVGAATASNASSQTPAISLSGLAGGISSAPAAGDIVFVAVGFLDATDQDIQCTTAGYTELADLKISGASSQMGVYFKRLTTAETFVSFNLGVATASLMVAHVWRNQNATQPDATTTTTSYAVTAAVSIDPPAITTSTNKAVVLAFAYSNSTATAVTAFSTPTGMSNLYQVGINNARIGVASVVVPTAGSYDPPTFGTRGGGGLGTGTGYIAATVAIRD